MDEIDINVKGQWQCYYRTVDKPRNIIDFLLCNRRDEKTARVSSMR
ncbi:DDE-type integrase/transposase/recombinase [Vibrio sp. F74]